MNSDAFTFVWQHSMQAFAADAWQALAGAHPFLSHALLSAFESSAAVGGDSGWYPHHLGVYDGEQLLAAMPVYLKTHSYGEYVFDWSWAEAYAQAGGDYYPKLVSAIPFSPVTGSRLLMHPACPVPEEVASRMLSTVQALCHQHQLSGAHVLFPDALSAEQCTQHGWLRRDAVQFRWQNHHYPDWAAFLATLSHHKRKKIKQERNKVVQQAVVCRVVDGYQATADDWALFYACYCRTYHLHGSQPYLPAAFFEALAREMPGQVALFIASQSGVDIAVSLCIHNHDTLYGRYWGSLQEVSCLHFELCYYQPQQFCIARGLRFFEGGAQGEHKLARGFVPYATYSFHWLTHADFRRSVARFLARELTQMQHYVTELEERSPYKQPAAPT